jgi:hypothetical protein
LSGCIAGSLISHAFMHSYTQHTCAHIVAGAPGFAPNRHAIWRAHGTVHIRMNTLSAWAQGTRGQLLSQIDSPPWNDKIWFAGVVCVDPGKNQAQLGWVFEAVHIMSWASSLLCCHTRLSAHACGPHAPPSPLRRDACPGAVHWWLFGCRDTHCRIALVLLQVSALRSITCASTCVAAHHGYTAAMHS